jgi:uncharacterized protein
MKTMRSRIVLGVIAAGVLLAFVGRHLLYRLYNGQPSTFFSGSLRHPVAEPVAPGTEMLRVASDSATVESLFLPATDGATGPKPLVIFAHGNSALIDDFVTALDGFRQRGVGVLLVEYPGYGRSTGAPSDASIRTAFDNAYDRMSSDPRVDPSRIIGFGQSFGGAAICLLAQDRPLRALILMSTATAFNVVEHHGTASPIGGPVLVIHGKHDPRISWQQGERLAAASPRAIFKLYDCEHDCWQPDRVPFWKDATPFLAQAGVALAVPP